MPSVRQWGCAWNASESDKRAVVEDHDCERAVAMKRRLIQFYAALSYNLNLKGFAEASVYKGRPKGLYVPGLDCYSCPGAVGFCPLDILQNALSTMDKKLPFYILGALLLFGVTTGRTICGSLCSLGLVQELLYRIPIPKIEKNHVAQELPKAKYVILTMFVIILPVVFKAASGFPVPAFCKYIRSAGTLEGGIPPVLLDDSLSDLAEALFHWKVLVSAVTLISACLLYRSSCHIPCPPGAIYSLLTPVALLGVRIDKDTCVDRGCYTRTCKVDIRQMGDRECIQCGECMEECNVGTTYWKKSWGVKSKK